MKIGSHIDLYEMTYFMYMTVSFYKKTQKHMFLGRLVPIK